jgi:hypothetical protein
MRVVTLMAQAREGYGPRQHQKDAPGCVHPLRGEQLLQCTILRDTVPGGLVLLLGHVRGRIGWSVQRRIDNGRFAMTVLA